MKCCSFLLGSAPRLPSRPPFIPATARLCLPQHSIAEAWCAFANGAVQFSTPRSDTTVKAISGAALRHQLVAPESCQDHVSFQLRLSAQPCIKHQNNDIYKAISPHHFQICNLPSTFLGTQRGRLHPFPTIGYSLLSSPEPELNRLLFTSSSDTGHWTLGLEQGGCYPMT